MNDVIICNVSSSIIQFIIKNFTIIQFTKIALSITPIHLFKRNSGHAIIKHPFIIRLFIYYYIQTQAQLNNFIQISSIFLPLFLIKLYRSLFYFPFFIIHLHYPLKPIVSIGWTLLRWLHSFEFNNFILSRTYNMKSPSRQVVKRDIKTSMNLLLQQDNPQKPTSNSSHFRRVICQTADIICRELQVIGWRYKTSLPIIRPVTYQLMTFQQKKNMFPHQVMRVSLNDSPKKSNSSEVDTKVLMQLVRGRSDVQRFTIQVVIESIQYRLSDLGCLPFSQIIYLLKEMMIGYDVLLDIFGSFEPTDEMIAVSSSFQWRVWINDDYTLNFKPEKSPNIGEKELIYKLIFIAEKHCTPTNLSKTFFAQIKQFTYCKECSFIKILEKIKQFISINKIFQVNKVTIAADKKINDSVQFDSKKQFTAINQNNSLTSIKLQKKGPQVPKPKFQASGFFQFQSKSTTNLMEVGKYNTSMMLSPSNHHNQKQMNISTMQSTNVNNVFAAPPQQVIHPFLSMRMLKSNNQKDKIAYKSKQGKDLTGSANMDANLVQKRMPMYQNMKPLSPQPIANRHPNQFISKSRLELKALVNPKKSSSPPPTVLQQKKPQKKPARKYSEQIVKVKSLQALTSKKFTGSNIYMNDPQTKVAVNVIKQAQIKPKIQNSGGYSTDQNKKLLSPNYSSPSTKQLKDSKESNKDSRNRGEDKYLSLKMNDLGCKQLRNNMSSYYGMGGSKPEEKRDKNMAVSYSFQNKNDDNSSESEKNEDRVNNNWTKKISGLFSDDASIKHLKGSVKFKTAEQEIFQKQYLKDVKLQMLEKFGRPVRHSIVDQQDDFEEPLLKNPYKSMQLIEQVFQDGKSHIQKQEQQQQIAPGPIRRRNPTVQIATCTKDLYNPVEIGKKQCFSQYCESQQVQSDGGFNFQTEAYVINPKR